MSAQAIYLQNALVPQARRIETVEPARIRDLAPADWQTPYVAFLDGEPVLRADWELVVEDGRSVAFIDVNAIPQGGGGGGSDPLRTILMIAVIIYAPQLAASLEFAAMGSAAMSGVVLSTGAMWGAAATMVGMALVNAILPPPKLPTPQQAGALAAPSPTYNLAAQGNSGRLESAIPEHFGRHIVFPDFAAQPYAEYSGNEQYLYQLLCIGRGQYDVEPLKIEDTPIANFNEIDYEVIPPGGSVTLFPTSVTNSIEVAGQTLATGVYAGPFVANASGTAANYIGIDIVAPRGLFYARDDGGLSAVSARITIEARQVDAAGAPVGVWVVLTDGAVYGPWSDWTRVAESGANTDTIEYGTGQGWVTGSGDAVDGGFETYNTRRTRNKYLNTQEFSGATTTPQRYSLRYAVAAGRYEVRIKRLDAQQTGTRYGHELIWAGMRAYLPEVRNFGDVTLIAMRLRASNNLSGQASRKINMVATRRLPVWNGAAWSAPVATRSIAWPIAYACKQIGMTDAQIDLASLRTLDAVWAARGDYFDARFDNFLSFWEAVSKIAQAGRAKLFMQGGVLRIMRDQAATVPVAMYSMRNIVKNSLRINYLMPTPDTADAVNVGYFDATAWKPLQVQAKLPASTAEKPAKIDLFGVTGRDHAFREGMYQAASNRYRRRVISFSTEMEGFIPSFGDLILIQHDMPAWGQGGEVTAWDAATRTATLSEPPQWGTGTHYIALRRRDGSVDGPYAVTAGAGANQVVLAASPAATPYTGGAEERTHYTFGWADTWSQRARVVSTRPRGLESVEIEAINEDDNVHTAEAGVATPARITSQLAGYVNAPIVTGLVASRVPGTASTYVLSWAQAAWATSYSIEQGSDAEGWSRISDIGGTNKTITLKSRSSQVRVAAIGAARGPWAQITITVPPPDDVALFSINGDVLSWAGVADYGLAGYQIRFNFGQNTWWPTAAPLHDGLITDTPYTMRSRPAGAVTLLIKAVDTTGNESVNATAIVTDLGDPLVSNILLDWPQAPTFSGAITGGAVSAGVLQATPTDLFFGPDAEPFFGADADPFFAATTYADLAYEWSVTSFDSGTLLLQHSVDASTWVIEYLRDSQAAFFGASSDYFFGADAEPFFGDPGQWLAWPGSIEISGIETIKFRVRASGGDTRGQISLLTTVLDVPDVTEKLDDVIISASGTRLPITKTYRVIKNIKLTVQADGNGGIGARIRDKNPTLGPLTDVLNSSDVGVVGLVDAEIQGY